LDFISAVAGFIFLLLICYQSAFCSDLYLISGKEEHSKGENPNCEIWKIDVRNKKIKKIWDMNNKKMADLSINYYPEESILLIWVNFIEKTNVLYIDTSKNISERQISIPFYPNQGKYLLIREGNPSISCPLNQKYKISNGISSGFYNVNLKTGIAEDVDFFDLESCRSPGYSWLRDSEGNNASRICTEIMKDGGVYLKINSVYTGFSIDKEILKSFASERFKRLNIPLLNKNHIVIRTSIKTKEGLKPYLLVYHKNEMRWNQIPFNKEYGPCQLFGDWLIAQKGSYVVSESEIVQTLESEFIAINLKNSKIYTYKFDIEKEKTTNKKIMPGNYWTQTGEIKNSAEILTVHGNRFIFKVQDEIYKSTISESEIKKSEVIIQDKRLRDVHWAFYR